MIERSSSPFARRVAGSPTKRGGRAQKNPTPRVYNTGRKNGEKKISNDEEQDGRGRRVEEDSGGCRERERRGENEMGHRK